LNIVLFTCWSCN